MTLIEPVRLYDGCTTKIRIVYPENTNIEKLVIYVNGSGPCTYDMKRKLPDGTVFFYHDLFAEECNKRHAAYCTYNTRGVEPGEDAPYFAAIEDKAYSKYLPSNSVKDVEAIITHLLAKDVFRHTKVFLLGWSEGTIIAPLVARNAKVRVDALLLAGYCNENLKDALTWQLSGNSLLTVWKSLLDDENKGYITKEDFCKDKNAAARQALFGEQSFEDADSNGDGRLDICDAAALTLPYLHNMLHAIENNDDDWLKNHHGIRLTAAWFQEHFALKPTKDVLPLLDLPIFLFQGEMDNACPVFYAEDIRQKFEELGKTNLTVRLFKDHDHDLNYMAFPLKKEISEGMASIFDTIEHL